MAPIKSISEVKDIYDLIELYANLDRNVDGMLGPDEVSAEEIKAGDKEGPYSDKPDTFLQPWEVMEMRGQSIFKPEDIARLRVINKAPGSRGYQAFVDIPSLPKDVQTFEDIPSLPRDVEIGGVTYKSGTSLFFSAYDSRVKSGVLARPTQLPFIPHTIFPPDSKIVIDSPRQDNFHANIQLGADAVINRIPCPKGTDLEFRTVEHNNILEITSKQGFLINNVRYAYAFLRNGVLLAGDLAQPTRLPVNQDTAYLFQKRIHFRNNGMVISGKLAEDVQSPYGGRYVHRSGSIIWFFLDGKPIERSRECFKARFPNIRLSTSVSEKYIRLVMEALSQLSPQTVANIKGIRFGHDDEAQMQFKEGKECGHANPFNKVIYMRKSCIESPIDPIISIIHEAAHIRHHALQDELRKRIAAATRHLDPTKPEDRAEDDLITQRIFSKSFDAKWSRAAGYDFSYSVADLISSGQSYQKYAEERHTTESLSEKDGFVNRYGRVSIWEDVATCVERIYEDPERFGQLINANSSFYKDQPDQRPYARVYSAKLDLLRKYGFITEDKYREIVPVHPDLWMLCQTVHCP